jgi:hypothetical protein
MKSFEIRSKLHCLYHEVKGEEEEEEQKSKRKKKGQELYLVF